MLELHDVVRRFGNVTAVDHVSFNVPDGALTGFVGGNGAGKTTTMRMIMGVLGLTSGQILMDGEEPNLRIRRSFGYMPEERGLYPKQSVTSQLTYLAELRGIPPVRARANVVDLLDRLGLGSRGETRLEELSLGNQQRVQIAAAFLGRPKLLVLDEPFSGLDPESVDGMAQFLREFADDGVAVLFSSHQLDLVERMCDRLVIVARGKLLAHGAVADLRSGGQHRHQLITASPAHWAQSLEGIDIVSVDGGTTVVQVRDQQAADRLLAEAVSRGSVFGFSEIVPTVADLYREMTA